MMILIYMIIRPLPACNLSWLATPIQNCLRDIILLYKLFRFLSYNFARSLSFLQPRFRLSFRKVGRRGGPRALCSQDTKMYITGFFLILPFNNIERQQLSVSILKNCDGFSFQFQQQSNLHAACVEFE